MSAENEKIRLDKWLWAARFYKTRALAKAAIEAGKVHCQGQRCKPSKEPKMGEQYDVRCGYDTRSVTVLHLSAQRQGASQAQLMYQESEQSLALRAEAALLRKAAGASPQTEGRPSKKMRRQWEGLPRE